jgi:hypothetical protein
MAELLLLNPRRRRKARKARSHRRVKRRRHVARAAPVRRRRRRSVMRVRRNPRRRRHYARVHRVHRNPRRRYRRNPSFGSLTSGILPTFKAGAVGAVGGLLNNILYGYLGPTQFNILPSVVTGSPAIVALYQALQAIGLGVVAKKVAPAYARDLAVGAMTVAIYGFAKTQLAAAMPSLPLSGLGAYLTMAPVVSDTSPGNYSTSSGGFYNPNVMASRALTRNTYKPVGGLGRMGRVGRVGRMGVYLGDATYGNGIPVSQG